MTMNKQKQSSFIHINIRCALQVVYFLMERMGEISRGKK